jgi:hypothetical protein
MTQKAFFRVSMLIFGIGGIVHLLRAFKGWEVQFGDTLVPVGLSWLVGIAALFLAYTAYKNLK